MVSEVYLFSRPSSGALVMYFAAIQLHALRYAGLFALLLNSPDRLYFCRGEQEEVFIFISFPLKFQISAINSIFSCSCFSSILKIGDSNF